MKDETEIKLNAFKELSQDLILMQKTFFSVEKFQDRVLKELLKRMRVNLDYLNPNQEKSPVNNPLWNEKFD